MALAEGSLLSRALRSYYVSAQADLEPQGGDNNGFSSIRIFRAGVPVTVVATIFLPSGAQNKSQYDLSKSDINLIPPGDRPLQHLHLCFDPNMDPKHAVCLKAGPGKGLQLHCKLVDQSGPTVINSLQLEARSAAQDDFSADLVKYSAPCSFHHGILDPTGGSSAGLFSNKNGPEGLILPEFLTAFDDPLPQEAGHSPTVLEEPAEPLGAHPDPAVGIPLDEGEFKPAGTSTPVNVGTAKSEEEGGGGDPVAGASSLLPPPNDDPTLVSDDETLVPQPPKHHGDPIAGKALSESYVILNPDDLTVDDDDDDAAAAGGGFVIV